MLADTDLWGHSITVVDTASALSCLGQCIQNPNCAQYTWVASHNDCHLKSDVVIPESTVLGMTSGRIDCGCLETNTGLEGANPLGQALLVDDPGLCQKTCALTPGCMTFTVDATGSDGLCYLWDGTGVKIDRAGFVYGPAVC